MTAMAVVQLYGRVARKRSTKDGRLHFRLAASCCRAAGRDGGVDLPWAIASGASHAQAPTHAILGRLDRK